MRTSIRTAAALGAALCIGLAPGSFAGQKSGSQVATSLKKKVTRIVSVDYLLYLPKEYGKDKAAKWPLILFLHGAGERGLGRGLWRASTQSDSPPSRRSAAAETLEPRVE